MIKFANLFSQLLHHFGASTIVAIYKDPWEIEILFKTLKQHSPGCLAAAQIPAPSIPVWLDFVKPGDDAAPESLYLSGFDDLVDPFGQAPLPPVIQLRLPGFGQPAREKRKKGTWLWKIDFTDRNPQVRQCQENRLRWDFSCGDLSSRFSYSNRISR